MKLMIIAGLAVTIFVSGCNTMVSKPSPIPPNTQFLGQPAQGLTLEVTSSIIWLYTGQPAYEELCRLPRGRYTAEGIDRNFIYFKGPGKVSYSMRTGIYSSDVEKKKGPGGIYFRRKGKSKMFSNVGGYITKSGRAERVIAGYESFLDEQGKSWKLIPK